MGIEKIYVASSWRNNYQPFVVSFLRNQGYKVYDFKNPGQVWKGFAWSQVDANWEQWDFVSFAQNLLKNPITSKGFDYDARAMAMADACVLVLPCGRSAHIEAGFFAGYGKPVFVFCPPVERVEPELMYKFFDGFFTHLEPLVVALNQWRWEGRKLPVPNPDIDDNIVW